MSELPEGWVQTTIGEVTTDAQQRSPKPHEEFLYIDISSIDREAKRILNPQHLNGENAPSRARKIVAVNDVIVSMTRPNLNAVAIVPPEFDGQIASTGFDVLRAVGIDARWLFYLVRSEIFISSMSDLVQGALYPAVRSKDVRGFNIPLAPLNEQKRIADNLDALLVRVDACRERLERVPHILKRFRQAILAAATSGQLTEDWREEQLPLPTARSITLKEVATEFSYGSSAKSSATGEVPVLRMGNIQEGKLVWDNLVFTSDAVEIKKYHLSPGDVLFNRTNSPELVGKTAVFKGERPAIYAGYLIRVRCGSELLPDYLSYCLNSPAGRDWCWRVKSDAVSQSNINAKKLAAFEFELPSLEEQQEIVRRVETLFTFADRLEARYKAARDQVERLTPALLAKAFRGELVPQDPNDEPASVLLDRIRAARTEEQNQPKPRRLKTPKTRSKAEVIMLKREDIEPAHLSTILKTRGPLTAEALWSASQLDIDDFYNQLKDEEARGLLKESRNESEDRPRLLEAA
ncbi:MAG TPA: restriction endonuclease subunit S [Pyrinomonadaceae bacterium]|nr:restriction endonuclease subunit S [Pyrinomonadaceae bacterium]